MDFYTLNRYTTFVTANFALGFEGVAERTTEPGHAEIPAHYIGMYLESQHLQHGDYEGVSGYNRQI